MSRKSLIPAALAALLAVTPAFAQQSSSGGTSGSSSSGGTTSSSSTDTSTDSSEAPSDTATDSAAGASDSKPSDSAAKPSDAESTTSGTAATPSETTTPPSEATTPPSATTAPSEAAQPRSPSEAGRSAAGQAGAQGSAQSQGRAGTQSRAGAQGTAGAQGRAGQGRTQTQGQSDASFESAAPGTQNRAQAGARAGTSANPSDSDDAADTSSRTRTGADVDSSIDTDADTDLDLNANDTDTSADAQQDSSLDTEADDREMRNRPSLDQEQGDDDFDTPARPENEEIPGQATGRPDNDELPGRAFNREQSQTDDDAQDVQQSERAQNRRSNQNRQRQMRQNDQSTDDANRSDRRDSRQTDRQQRRDARDRSDRDTDLGVDAEGEANVDANLSESLGVEFDTSSRNQLVISSLTDDSILANAGIQQGDVLMSIDGQRVSSMAQFNRLLTNVEASQRIPLIVQRDGAQQRIYLTGDQLVDVYGGRSYSSSFWNTVGLRLADNAGRLVINSIAPNSYFADYGFQPGDVIVSAYGRPVRSMSAFQSILVDADAGTRIPVAVYRDGQQETIYVTTREFNSSRTTQQYAASSGAWLGVRLDPQYDNGALVSSVERGSPAQRAGVRPGDWILSVNGQDINSPDHLSQVIGQMDPEQTVDLEVSRRANLRLEADLQAQPRAYVGSRTEQETRYNRQGGRFDYDSRTGNQQEWQDNEQFYEDADGYDDRTGARANIRATQGYENRTDDRGAFEVGDGDGRILNRDEGRAPVRGGVRGGRIFGGNR